MVCHQYSNRVSNWSRTGRAAKRRYIPQIIGALGSVLTLIALLLAIGLHGSLAWLVFASTMGSVIATVFNAWLLFREHPWLIPARHAYRRSAASKILNLGLMFFVLQCAGTLAYSSDNIVIAQVLGAAAVAAYAVPQKLFGFVSMVVSMAIGPLWPAYGEALARGDVAWVRRVFFGSLWLTLGITVPLWRGLGDCSRPLDTAGVLRQSVAGPHGGFGGSGSLGRDRCSLFDGGNCPEWSRCHEGTNYRRSDRQLEQSSAVDLSYTPVRSDWSLFRFDHHATRHYASSVLLGNSRPV